MTAMNLIEAALAAPKTHEVVTTYACGKVRRFQTRSLASAENHAVRDRHNIGRPLISRNDDLTAGPMITIVSVEVKAL